MIKSAKARFLALSLALAAVGGCMDENGSGVKHLRPLSGATLAELKEKDMRKEDPILIRIYKEEAKLEVWKKRQDGRFALFKDYEICAYSGNLGPKLKEGDRQAPEGFYTITPAQMNPNSSYHLAFNMGYPNTFDKAHGRTGKHLMVHGACSSAGCYAMTDEGIQEIYSLAREAFRGGQRDFQVQALPFRMTPENMARHADDPNMPFWRNLKEGVDHFEVTGLAPAIGVCDRRYVFNARPQNDAQRLDPLAVCPKLEVPENIQMAVASKQMRDETAFQVALADLRGKAIESQQATPAPVMVAMDMPLEEGSTEGYETAAADASEATLPEAAATPAPQVASAAPAAVPARQVAQAAPTTSGLDPDLQSAAANPVASAFGASPTQANGATAGTPGGVATAFTGVWDRIVDFARFDTPRKPANEPAVAPESDLPELSSAASSFAPRLFPEDPFKVFGLFETVDGVSVPADTVRR